MWVYNCCSIYEEGGDIMGKYEELERLNKLKENGTLSEEEFEKEKKNILNETSGNSSKINENIVEKYSEKNKTETKVANKKAIKPFLISFIIVILSIGAISAVVATASQKTKNNTVSKSNTENTYNNNVQNYERKNDENTSVQNLSYIDLNKKEFKIDAKELANAIIKSNDELEEENREAFKTQLVYKTESQIDPLSGKNVTVYTLCHKGFENLGFNTVPFMLVANTDTNNVYRISVSYPYLNNFGTEMNTTAIRKNYELLKIALNKINKGELYDTIVEISTDIEKIFNEGKTLPSNWNKNGVYVGDVDGIRNSYGNLTNFYIFYGTR